MENEWGSSVSSLSVCDFRTAYSNSAVLAYNSIKLRKCRYVCIVVLVFCELLVVNKRGYMYQIITKYSKSMYHVEIVHHMSGLK